MTFGGRTALKTRGCDGALARWGEGARAILSASALVVTLSAVLALPAWSSSEGRKAADGKGIESEGYVWNENAFETQEALRLPGNVDRGESAYEACAHCHLPRGSGQADGVFPQIAGQHATVLIKQLIDIRDGRRDNPLMQPYAAKLTDPQELADLALYIRLLAFRDLRVYGQGDDLERAEGIYARDCAACHGTAGQGDAERFYPIVAGQNYHYLLRQLREVASGQRRNSHPEMVQNVSKLEDADLVALADYLSRLRWPAPRVRSRPNPSAAGD